MTLAAVASSSPSLRAEDPRTTGATALSLIDTTMPASATATTVADPRASVSSNDAATAARNTEDVTYSQLSPLTTASARFDALTDSILNNAEEPAAQTRYVFAAAEAMHPQPHKSDNRCAYLFFCIILHMLSFRLASLLLVVSIFSLVGYLSHCQNID